MNLADLVVLARLVRVELRDAQEAGHVLGGDLIGPVLAVFEHLARDLAAHAADLPLEITNAALHRVVMDHRADRVLGDLQIHVAEAGFLLLAVDQVAHGDVELLELRVAGELDDLHPVLERERDAAERVRGRDEHHVREVVVEVEVVVVERGVLLGIEHLEERRRRVAPEVARHLVDLVEEEDRVVRADLAQRLDDPAGEGADVRAPVAADLRLVADAAEAQPDELAARGARDGLAPATSCRRRAVPTRQSTGPFSFFTSACTARYSRMRSLTFFRP